MGSRAAARDPECEFPINEYVISRTHAKIIKRWGGEQPLESVVRRVEPTGFTKISALGVEEQRVLVICDITSPYAEWQALGDGYRVEAEFVLWEAAEVLQVPASALFRTGADWAVFRVAGGRALAAR